MYVCKWHMKEKPAIKGYPVCMWQGGGKVLEDVWEKECVCACVCMCCVCTCHSTQRQREKGAASGGVYGAGGEREGKVLQGVRPWVCLCASTHSWGGCCAGTLSIGALPRGL